MTTTATAVAEPDEASYPDLDRLLSILISARPYQSKAEETFRWTFLRDYAVDILFAPATLAAPATETGQQDVYAYYIDVPDADGTVPPTLFSCHTDTAGRSEEPHKLGRRIDRSTIITVVQGDCLGADDGAGVWLLLQMIDAGVPGTYIFHRGEERGGIGSSGIASYHKNFLARYKRAIAFDRRGTYSVITHQGFGRCCSDAFATKLAEELTTASGDRYFFAPDNTGVFTDTANYTDVIPECTNVSVGYYSEHTANEMLDLEYLYALRDACLALDWEALPTERNPSVADYDDMFYYGRYSSRGVTYPRSWSGAAYAVDTTDDTLDVVTSDPPSIAELAAMEYDDLYDWIVMADYDDIAYTMYTLLCKGDVEPGTGAGKEN